MMSGLDRAWDNVLGIGTAGVRDKFGKVIAICQRSGSKSKRAGDGSNHNSKNSSITTSIKI